MTCQECDEKDPECQECEKHPTDIHTTPPPQWIFTSAWHNTMDLRTPEQRIAQLERDVHELRNTLQALVLKAGL